MFKTPLHRLLLIFCVLRFVRQHVQSYVHVAFGIISFCLLARRGIQPVFADGVFRLGVVHFRVDRNRGFKQGFWRGLRRGWLP